MNQKIAALIAIAMIVSIAAAGCLGGGGDTGEDDGAGEPKLELKTGKMPTVSGWAERQSGGVANVDIPINIPSSMVTKVNVRILVEDSDAEHSETDEGSDPDDISVKISMGNKTDERGPMPTPATFNIDLTPPPGEYLPGTGNIRIDGVLNDGKAAYFFGFIVYVDQGFAYRVDVEYSYLQEVA